MLRIDGLDELKAAALLWRQAEPKIRRGIAKEARSWAPELKAAAGAGARTPLDKRIAADCVIRSTQKGLSAVFGSKGTLSDGRPLAVMARPQEFGTTRQRVHRSKYMYRRRGVQGAVFVGKESDGRLTMAGLPRKAADGRFLYPALAKATPELVSRYVRVIAEAVTRA